MTALMLGRGRILWPSRETVVLTTAAVLLVAWLLLTLVMPLAALLSKAFLNAAGEFVGFANFVRWGSTPSLVRSLQNSMIVASLTTLIAVPIAFALAYSLTRSRMPGRGIFQAIALLPIFAPSLLPAFGLIYLFGNQGFLKSWLFGRSIYGPIGIVLGEVIYCLPHALLVLIASLRLADARLFEAAEALGASRLRRFLTVTVPGARYGLVSATFIVFTLAVTDFGIPKVLGGQFDVLATDAYKQVVGQQNFEMGAVVGLVLLMPAVLAFAIDRLVSRRQGGLMGARAVPLVPQSSTARDSALFLGCSVVSVALLAVFGIAIWASFIKYWPYNFELTLQHYNFENAEPTGWQPYRNSLLVGALTASVGTVIVFCGAWLIEKTPVNVWLRTSAQFLAMLPMAVPGLVLGLGYVFFINQPASPAQVLYGTIAVLVLNTIAHFYTVGHMTSVTALKQIDPEFEAVSRSLSVPLWQTLRRVTAPISLTAILDIWVYFFVNALTTVSSIIFLYGSETKLAAVSIVHMDEAGATAAAAALASVILVTALVIKLFQMLLEQHVFRSLHTWRGLYPTPG